jgi:CxxC-x17-CxxC domain-containing protein
MRSFNTGRSSRPSFGKSDKPQMHNAVCDECGRDCQVPFKPTGSKPIYCSKCFEKHDDSRSDRGPRGEMTMHDAVCDDCGKDCKVPFKPSSDKPIYCSECFEKRGNGKDTGRRSSRGEDGKNNYRDEFAGIHKKLDLILSILESRDL